MSELPPIDWTGRDKRTVVLDLTEQPVTREDGSVYWAPVLDTVSGAGEFSQSRPTDLVFTVRSDDAALLAELDLKFVSVSRKGRTMHGVWVDAPEGFESEISPDGKACALRIDPQFNRYRKKYALILEAKDGRTVIFDPGTGNDGEPKLP